jgi:hypothetical protein
MTDHRDNYLLWTAVTRDDGANGLSYAFPDVETEIEQTLEAVVAEPPAELGFFPTKTAENSDRTAGVAAVLAVAKLSAAQDFRGEGDGDG